MGSGTSSLATPRKSTLPHYRFYKDPEHKLKNRRKYFNKGRQPMVGWYASQLFSTAWELLVSTTLSASHDVRLLNALQTTSPRIIDESMAGEKWIDFVADTGDGFNSTYSVVYKQTQHELTLEDPKNLTKTGKPVTTKRGSVLLFGGDLTYPTPSVENYDLRFKKTYEMAFPWADHTVPGCEDLGPDFHPNAYAIPGNHDWYDSLTVFGSLFLNNRNAEYIEEGERIVVDGAEIRREISKKLVVKPPVHSVWLGGYALGQDQSYFAIKFPKRWWVFGLDFGLMNDLDIHQLRYFLWVIESQMVTAEHNNIILMCHEPLWWYSEFESRKNWPMNVKYLLKRITKAGHVARLWLAGDIHNYRRDTSDDGQYHKLIAGGGGAFLHPTGFLASGKSHTDGPKDNTRTFTEQAVYPSKQACRWINLLNIFFPIMNPYFGFVTATIYCSLLWWIQVDLTEDPNDFLKAFIAFNNPMPVGFVIVLLVCCIYFADGSRYPKIIKGTLHAAVHCTCIIGTFYLGLVIVPNGEEGSGQYGNIFARILVHFVCGYFFGSFVMGLYLLMSAMFGFHWNEAFSSIKCPWYKSFLRMHITPTGELEVFCIGIDTPGVLWQTAPYEVGDYKKSLIAPRKGWDFPTKLVDYIVLKPLAAGSQNLDSSAEMAGSSSNGSVGMSFNVSTQPGTVTEIVIDGGESV